MSVTQTGFIQALLDPDLATPKGLSDPQGRPAGRRFSVYRNNVAVSLTEALQTAYPVVFKLVGEKFFNAMAGLYLRQHPPSSPLMMHYGEEMPAFLEGFEPVAHLGYLPDVARLEMALRRSYHAADREPIDPTLLQDIAPDNLMLCRFSLAPSCILLRSAWPTYDLWQANTQSDAPSVRAVAQDVLITRPQFDPAVNLLPPGGGAFVDALQGGAPLQDSLAAAGTDFDLAAMLGILLSGGAITRIESGANS